jgi:hypothetical protein
MIRLALAAATAAAVFTAASSFVAVPAKAENLKMAQVGVEIGVGQDRGVREERVRRERRDSDVTVGVGPGGVRVGPRDHCRMVTTKVERDDGSSITRKERRCD